MVINAWNTEIYTNCENGELERFDNEITPLIDGKITKNAESNGNLSVEWGFGLRDEDKDEFHYQAYLCYDTDLKKEIFNIFRVYPDGANSERFAARFTSEQEQEIRRQIGAFMEHSGVFRKVPIRVTNADLEYNSLANLLNMADGSESRHDNKSFAWDFGNGEFIDGLGTPFYYHTEISIKEEYLNADYTMFGLGNKYELKVERIYNFSGTISSVMFDENQNYEIIKKMLSLAKERGFTITPDKDLPLFKNIQDFIKKREELKENSEQQKTEEKAIKAFEETVLPYFYDFYVSMKVLMEATDCDGTLIKVNDNGEVKVEIGGKNGKAPSVDIYAHGHISITQQENERINVECSFGREDKIMFGNHWAKIKKDIEATITDMLDKRLIYEERETLKAKEHVEKHTDIER